MLHPPLHRSFTHQSIGRFRKLKSSSETERSRMRLCVQIGYTAKSDHPGLNGRSPTSSFVASTLPSHPIPICCHEKRSCSCCLANSSTALKSPCRKSDPQSSRHQLIAEFNVFFPAALTLLPIAPDSNLLPWKSDLVQLCCITTLFTPSMCTCEKYKPWEWSSRVLLFTRLLSATAEDILA